MRKKETTKSRLPWIEKGTLRKQYVQNPPYTQNGGKMAFKIIQHAENFDTLAYLLVEKCTRKKRHKIAY